MCEVSECQNTSYTGPLLNKRLKEFLMVKISPRDLGNIFRPEIDFGISSGKYLLKNSNEFHSWLRN